MEDQQFFANQNSHQDLLLYYKNKNKNKNTLLIQSWTLAGFKFHTMITMICVITMK